MPPFGSRKARTPEITQPGSAPEPAQKLADAEAALNALLGEQAEAQATLIEHQQQRHEWLRDGGELQRITDLDRDDYQLRLRLEQIAMQLPPRQAAVQQARAAVHEARWQGYRPTLVQAEQRLATAISDLYSALTQVQDAHNAAHRAGFAGQLGEFLRPPPNDPVSDFALREFVKAVEQRQRPIAASTPMVEFTVSDRAPWQPRFTPRKVPHHLIEQVSPLSERKIRVLHSVNVTNLNFGHRKLISGTEMVVPGPAAFALTYAGVAEYADAETAEMATAAA